MMRVRDIDGAMQHADIVGIPWMKRGRASEVKRRMHRERNDLVMGLTPIPTKNTRKRKGS